MPAGRPREYDRDKIAKALAKYIEANEIPILAEFAYQHKITRELMYDWPELSTLIKLCVTKKESALERKALSGDCNVTMAIFSLKQLGWSDKQETKHSGQIVAINGELAKV